MKPLFAALAFVALIAGLVAVGLYLLRDDSPGPEVIDRDLGGRDGETARIKPLVDMPRGGVYAGIVVDRAGDPVRSAPLLLVAFDTGQEAFQRQAQSDPTEFDPSNLAVVGFRTGASGKTDAAGRFRIAADRDSAIRAVFAWKEGFSPSMVPVEGPREGIRIVLDPAGQFIGHVVDGGTGQPIVGANVAIYLQSKAIAAPEKLGERARGGRLQGKVSVFARAQRWVAKTLGPLVFGSEWQGDETIRVYSDRDGTFKFGPINDEVQLEFVITHPEYEWTEFDRGESGRVRRTVVPPGETVERTFRLQPGKSIAGKVIDRKTGRGVQDVRVGVEHVAQYDQHWWYRTKKRWARTGRDGTFEVKGLSYGEYTAVLEHPTFGREHISNIPEGADNLQWYVDSRGALVGRVEGMEGSTFNKSVTLTIEAIGDVIDQARHQRIETRLNEKGEFTERGIKPGRWSVWVQAGPKSSPAQTIEIQSLQEAHATFTLADGGRLLLSVWDAAGQAVDPADVGLVKLSGDDDAEQPLGRFVTREGKLDALGVAPGRYLVVVGAPGYLSVRTEPFDLREGGTTDLGEVTLRRQAILQITGVVGADGRSPRQAVRLSVKEGDGDFRRLPMLTQSEVPVSPGPLTVRAECDDGTSFEQTVEALDGQTVQVQVRLSP